MNERAKASKMVLLVDDEPEFLDWLEEHLNANGYTVRHAVSLPEAMKTLAEFRFRLVLVDMNIPALDSIRPELAARSPLVAKYPGLAVAITCRNNGYGAHSVIAYTVHDDSAAEAELEKLHCRYVLKGRPQVLKRVLQASLAEKPKRRRQKEPPTGSGHS